MTNLMSKLSNAFSSTVLFAAAIVMAGLGLAFVGTLALFGFLAFGLAMIVAPFVKTPESDDAEISA